MKLIAFIALLVVLYVGYTKYYLPKRVCAQVVTSAKHRITGEVKEFGAPCHIPFWYEKI